MNVASNKPKPRNSMRVATVFTGVAAATAGMAQAANAQGVGAAVHKPASRHIARQTRLATRVKHGSIRSSYNCAISGIHSHWVHLGFYSVNLQFSESVCYGYKGYIYSPPGAGVTYACGGNNYGAIGGYSKGRWWSYDYHQGNTYAYLDEPSLYYVSIAGWAGTDKCGFRP